MSFITEFCLSWALMWAGPQNLRTLSNSSGLLTQLRIAVRQKDYAIFLQGPNLRFLCSLPPEGKMKASQYRIWPNDRAKTFSKAGHPR